jgi:hypothetical protein
MTNKYAIIIIVQKTNDEILTLFINLCTILGLFAFVIAIKQLIHSNVQTFTVNMKKYFIL